MVGEAEGAAPATSRTRSTSSTTAWGEEGGEGLGARVTRAVEEEEAGGGEEEALPSHQVSSVTERLKINYRIIDS